MVRCPLHPQAAPKKITIKIGIHSNPKTQAREANKNGRSSRNGTCLYPNKTKPETTPCGLISDLACYCIFIKLLMIIGLGDGFRGFV